MFLDISVSHIMPGFVVLLVGTVFNSVVFIVEIIGKCLCRHKEEIKANVH